MSERSTSFHRSGICPPLEMACPAKIRATKGVKFVPSSVDETLFGARESVHVPYFEPPWVDNGRDKLKTLPRPLLFYRPVTSPSVDCANQPSAPSSYQPIKFSPSYVDESLFGRRRTKRSDSPPPKEFEPPWAKESDKKKDKPILFDCSSRLMFDNRSSESSQPPSKLSRRPQTTGNTSSRFPVNYKKAPWR